MEKLTELPNIGGKLAELLERSGIETPEQLRNLGSNWPLKPKPSYWNFSDR
ncbi:MAG: TfoX/Sxy family DNA transformation protein [Bacillota bacterium]